PAAAVDCPPLHDALPILVERVRAVRLRARGRREPVDGVAEDDARRDCEYAEDDRERQRALPAHRENGPASFLAAARERLSIGRRDRKSTRLNSSHGSISY